MSLHALIIAVWLFFAVVHVITFFTGIFSAKSEKEADEFGSKWSASIAESIYFLVKATISVLLIYFLWHETRL